MKTIALAACSLVMAVLLSTSARAQAPGAPRRPTLSPYLDLLRAPTGELPSYQQFVRPKIQQRQLQIQQNQQLGQLSRRISTQQQQLNTTQQQIYTATGVRPTGILGGHRVYLHFYPTAGGVTRGGFGR